MHLAAKLLGGMQAHYTDKFESTYESKLSAYIQIHLYIVHWKPNIENNLNECESIHKYQKFVNANAR